MKRCAYCNGPMYAHCTEPVHKFAARKTCGMRCAALLREKRRRESGQVPGGIRRFA